MSCHTGFIEDKAVYGVPNQILENMLLWNMKKMICYVLQIVK